jgi:hypothetical protein
MKKELSLLLILFLLVFISRVFSQNETILEENNITISEEGNTTTTLEENKTLVPEENKTEVTKKTTEKYSKPVVSLCEGCSTGDADNPCIEVGTQKQETDGTTFYCSSGKKLETAKEAGENCNNDYECLTYTCNEGLCFEEPEEETGIKTSQILLILGAVILIGGLAFLALRFLNTKKDVVKEEKKVEKKGFEIQEPEQKYSYKYRPEFDVLEKKLKESLNPKK